MPQFVDPLTDTDGHLGFCILTIQDNNAAMNIPVYVWEHKYDFISLG